MNPRVVTPPAQQPISLAQAKLFCRVDNDDDDTLLVGIIASATTSCEQILQRKLITQTLEYTLDSFAQPRPNQRPLGLSAHYATPNGWADRIELPWGPFESIVSVDYLDENGASQTVAVADYYVLQVDPAVLLPGIDFSWPATYTKAGAVTIRYIAGYGYAAELIPEPILSWLRIRINTLWANRDLYVMGKTVATLQFVDAMLDPYKIMTIV